MPVQINEVVVRTSVDTKETCTPAAGDEKASKGAALDESELVERVLEIIRESRER
jgi:hypothetical protein